jgi:hypothetical protein
MEKIIAKNIITMGLLLALFVMPKITNYFVNICEIKWKRWNLGMVE